MKLAKKNDKENKILLDVKKINDELDTAELVCTKTDGTKYDFNRFSSPLKFVEKIYNYEISLDKAIGDQKKLENLISKLKKCKAKNLKKLEEKNKLLESAVKLFLVREDIVGFFEKGTFLYKVNVFKTKKEESEQVRKNER